MCWRVWREAPERQSVLSLESSTADERERVFPMLSSPSAGPVFDPTRPQLGSVARSALPKGGGAILGLLPRRSVAVPVHWHAALIVAAPNSRATEVAEL